MRKLLDEHDAQTAYSVARDAAPPMRGNYRVDASISPPAGSRCAICTIRRPPPMHFAHIAEGHRQSARACPRRLLAGPHRRSHGPARQAKAFYETAAQYTATYYGQLARARLGLSDLGLRGPPAFTPQEQAVLSNLEVVRAAEILYELDERDMLASIYAELGESGTDIAGMAVLGELAGKHGDGRAMLLLGEAAYGRGLPLDYYAYPIVGLPDYKPIAPPIEAAVAYSIARQESHFNQKVVSTAHAMGLMQVTPAAGIDTAAKFKVHLQPRPPAQGSGLQHADGRGRALQSVHRLQRLLHPHFRRLQCRARPRAAVDRSLWRSARSAMSIRSIGSSASRSPRPAITSQRIMENLQVYRARFGGGTKLLIEADLKRGSAN